MKLNNTGIVSLILIIIFCCSGLSKVAAQEDFVTIYTTVFHPGPDVDDSKTVEWDFDSDGEIDSTEKDASYAFPGVGSYSVKLRISDETGTNIITKTITIDESVETVFTGPNPDPDPDPDPNPDPDPEPDPELPENWLAEGWSKRILFRVNAGEIASNLTDFPVYMDLANLPAEFFEDIQDTAADLRITKADGKTELAREIVFVDKASQTGELHFKADTLSSTEDTSFYIYFANSDASEPTEESASHASKVWNDNYIAVWHNQEAEAGVTTAAGKLAGQALDFNGVNVGVSKGDDEVFNLSNDYTIQFWSKGSNFNHGDCFISKIISGARPNGGWSIIANKSDGTTKLLLLGYNGTPYNAVSSNTAINTNNWFMVHATQNSNTATIYLNGQNDGSEDGVVSLAPSIQNVNLGSRGLASSGGQKSAFLNANLDEVRILSEDLSPDWIAAEYANQNSPDNFITAISMEEQDGSSIEIAQETPIPEDWMDGAWSNRIKFTINSDKVAGDLTDFPVYLDLANLPAEFFNSVKADGSDIRITKADGTTELAREVVSVDQSSRTGEIHFKASLNANINTEFYIYYGNTTPVLAESGEKTWDSSYVTISHMDQVPTLDSSSTTNTISSLGEPTITSGKAGKALYFDGKNDYLRIGNTNEFNFGTGDFTISSWVKIENLNNKNGGFFDRIWLYGESVHKNSIALNIYNGKLQYRINDKVKITTPAINSNWHHLALVRYNGQTKIYIDGINSGNTYNASDLINYPYAFAIAANRDGSTVPFLNGSIDEFRISKSGHSEQWIKTEYNNVANFDQFINIGSEESISQ